MGRYCLARAAITQECTATGGFVFRTVESSKSPFDRLDESQLVHGANEWRLLHGAASEACMGTCNAGLGIE